MSKRDLLRTAFRAREKQAQDVHAGDHQQECRAAQEHQQHRTYVAEHHVAQRDELANLRMAMVRRIRGAKLFDDGRHFRRGHLH
jgi:hypothetical protein